MAQAKRLPMRFLNLAMRKFRRELREVEKLARSVSNIDEDEIELETDFEDVTIATEVTQWIVPNGWIEKAAMVLGQDGVLRLTGLRDTYEYGKASFTFEAFLCKPGNGLRLFTHRPTRISPPNMPQYYVQRQFVSLAHGNRQYLVVEVDFGYHSLSYWLDRARVYLTDSSVFGVVILQFFPLRRSAFMAGLYKRAAVAVVLGRVATAKKQVSTGQQQATSDYEVCILEELSFGNAPLARNIRETLASVSTPTHAAPRGELRFTEPAYAAAPMPLNATREARFDILDIGDEHPHLLTITKEAGANPWIVNMGLVFTSAFEGWMQDQDRRVR